jgi:hypothetical protein
MILLSRRPPQALPQQVETVSMRCTTTAADVDAVDTRVKAEEDLEAGVVVVPAVISVVADAVVVSSVAVATVAVSAVHLAVVSLLHRLPTCSPARPAASRDHERFRNAHL